jgi:hypothetical protein
MCSASPIMDTPESDSQAPDPADTTFAQLPNDRLLAALDEVLLELERRLLHYARVGGELREMADEGLVLATRTGARLRQALSAAAHTTGHLQVLGVGNWTPTSTNPNWSDDPRVTGNPDTPNDAG